MKSNLEDLYLNIKQCILILLKKYTIWGHNLVLLLLKKRTLFSKIPAVSVHESKRVSCCSQLWKRLYSTQGAVALSWCWIFWSKPKPSWKLSRLDWVNNNKFHFSWLYFLLRSNCGFNLLVKFLKSTNTFFSPQAFWEIKVVI